MRQSYSWLTREERYQIELLLHSGSSLRTVARQMNRAPSTICRELVRAKSTPETYAAKSADTLAKSLHSQRRPERLRIQGDLRRTILAKLKIEWSPEQIEGWIKHRCPTESSVACSTIYRFIYAQDSQLGLYRHLRRAHIRPRPRRKYRSPGPFYLTKKRDRVTFENRPRIVEKRSRIGDFERDTMRGLMPKAELLVLVDRTSRRVLLDLLTPKSADNAHNKTVRRLRNEQVLTITNDNGMEFSEYRKTAKVLRAPIYFTHPGNPWERGTSENLNGLLRQYFPRTRDFKTITPQELREAERRLNHRPRKCLDYRTPTEVHQIYLNRSPSGLGTKRCTPSDNLPA